MELDIRSKLCIQLGSLMLGNIEIGHQLEGVQAQLAKMQADAKAAAEAQASHDAAADARDMPSGAPAGDLSLP